MKRVLYIGRFNPPHIGHLKAIEYILKSETSINQVIIGIGSAQESFTPSNPFTAGERFELLSRALKEFKVPENKYLIIPVPDLNNNNQWIAYLISLLPSFDIIYSNNSLVKLLAEKHGNLIVKPIPLMNRDNWSATTIRAKIASNDNSWKELVPDVVSKYLNEIDGITRIQLLSREDK